MIIDWLWVPFTLIAAAAQTARNSMQKELTNTLGVVGATHVRFVYGLPFAALFLLAVCAVEGAPPSVLQPGFLAWTAGGALAQVAATALMLSAMRRRSFVVTIAYIKIEPVLVLLFGVLVLGETPGAVAGAGVFVATAGVMLMSWPARNGGGDWLRTSVIGVASGAAFALSAVLFRGGILSLTDASFVLRATTTLVVALTIQTAAIIVYLRLLDRRMLHALLGGWRASMAAGLAGALASQFWFLAFAVQSASLVRALALVEIVFAQAVSRRVFRQTTTPREIAGMLLVGAGVLFLAVPGFR